MSDDEELLDCTVPGCTYKVVWDNGRWMHKHPTFDHLTDEVRVPFPADADDGELLGYIAHSAEPELPPELHRIVEVDGQ